MAFGKGTAKAGAAQPAQSGFARKGAAGATGAKAGAKAKAPAKPGSMWAGLEDPNSRDPIIGQGHYFVEVLGAEVKVHPVNGTRTFKGSVKVLGCDGKCEDAEGDERCVIEMLDGKAAPFGRPRAGAFMAAAAGFDSVAAMSEFSPDGAFSDALLGESNQFSEAGATIVGRRMYVKVNRGNNVLSEDGQLTGDYYRECSYTHAEEDEQQVPAFEGVVQ